MAGLRSATGQVGQKAMLLKKVWQIPDQYSNQYSPFLPVEVAMRAGREEHRSLLLSLLDQTLVSAPCHQPLLTYKLIVLIFQLRKLKTKDIQDQRQAQVLRMIIGTCHILRLCFFGRG